MQNYKITQFQPTIYDLSLVNFLTLSITIASIYASLYLWCLLVCKIKWINQVNFDNLRYGDVQLTRRYRNPQISNLFARKIIGTRSPFFQEVCVRQRIRIVELVASLRFSTRRINIPFCKKIEYTLNGVGPV